MFSSPKENDCITLKTNEVHGQLNLAYLENSGLKAWFPLDRNKIVKSCDSSRFWLIVERLITLESKNLTEIGLDLQFKRFLP